MVPIGISDLEPKGSYAENPGGKNLQNWKCSPWVFLLGKLPKYHFEMLPLRTPEQNESQGKLPINQKGHILTT